MKTMLGRIARISFFVMLFALAVALCGVAVFAEEGGEVSAVTESSEITELASGTCGTNLTWILTSDGTLTISGEGEMEDYTGTTTPWYEHKSSRSFRLWKYTNKKSR